MAKSDLARDMRRHAEAAAEMVLAEYQHDLDFSEPTIGAVDAILNGFWRERGSSDDLSASIALLFGSYVGELIRHGFPQATWVRVESAPDGLDSPFVQVDDIQLFPMTWCYKQLHNGPEDSVTDKYLAFRNVMDERSQR